MMKAMRLFRRQNADVSSSDEMPEETPEGQELMERAPHNQRATALKILASALVVALIALAAAWAFHGGQKNGARKETPGKGTTQVTKKPSKPSNGKKSGGSSGSSAPSSTPAPAASPTPVGGSQSTPQNGSRSGSAAGAAATSGTVAAGNLTNTGPGDVAIWAIVAAVGTTSVYYFVILRRLTDETQR